MKSDLSDGRRLERIERTLAKPALAGARGGALLLAFLWFLVDQLARVNADDPTGTFTGRLESGSIGVVGHSFGGATAAQFCHDDARCQAGMDIDGALYGAPLVSAAHFDTK